MNISKLFNSAKKRVVAGAIVALAMFVPMSQAMAASVSIEGTMGVANKTAGATTYSKSTNASYNDVVKIEVYYHNRELPDSGKIAKNLNVKIDIPSTAGKTQTQTATISGDNTNTVTAKTTVNLDRSDAYLQYLPGSAVWRHNTGTNDAPIWTDTVISDSIVSSGSGLTLEDEKPCYNFSATVTVLARVMVPGVSVDKYVRIKGDTEWKRSITAKPGETVQYEIAYKNTGNSVQTDVVARDQLPAGMTYVAGSALLKNTNFPNATQISDAIVGSNGVIIGTYNPGSAGYVLFEAKTPALSKLECGTNKFRNIAYIQPSGMNYYYNTADVTVNKECTTTEKPVYSCDLLKVTKGDNRTVTASLDGYTAKNGATLKLVTFNFGDGKVVTTDKLSATHTYAADGTYGISTKLTFSIVDENDVSGITSEGCAATVTFTTPETPPELPNTGAGDVIGIFGAVAIVSTIGYRLFLGRKSLGNE